MKRQFIACRDCSTTMAEIFDSPDGRRLMRWSFGAPLLTVRDGEPTTREIHSQRFTVDIEHELADCDDSFIDMQCQCAQGGSPRSHNVALRVTLERLGTHRSVALPLDEG